MLEVHLHALWQLPHQNATPPKVTEVERSRYDNRFTNVKAVRTSVHASLDANARDIDGARDRVHQFLESLPHDGSSTANHIRHIPENHLIAMFRSVAHLGLARWAPDILGSEPDSMYNILHEQIALFTFEQVAASFGYSHLGINLQLVQNDALICKLYRNFVFSHMAKIAKLEAKTLGSIVKGNEMTNVWKHRQDV